MCSRKSFIAFFLSIAALLHPGPEKVATQFGTTFLTASRKSRIISLVFHTSLTSRASARVADWSYSINQGSQLLGFSWV